MNDDQQWWNELAVEVADVFGMPADARIPTPVDVAEACDETWMADARRECITRLHRLNGPAMDQFYKIEGNTSKPGPGFPLGALSFGLSDEYQGDEYHVKQLVSIFPQVDWVYRYVKDKNSLLHPLAALIEGWLRYQMARPQNIRVLLSDEKSKLARSINHHKTAALAIWEDVEAVFVEVDAEAMASIPPQAPARALGFPPRDQPRGALLPPPGQRAAADLRLLWAWNFDQLGFDRRKTIAADVFYLLTLSGAMIDKVIVPVADVGAWLRGDFSAEGLGKFHRKQRWKRGMAGLLWATRRLRLAVGTIMPLLEMNQLGVEDDKIFSAELVELRPWGWAKWKTLHGRIPGWRLTGGLAHCELRHDKTGILARAIAGMEDCLAVEARA